MKYFTKKIKSVELTKETSLLHNKMFEDGILISFKTEGDEEEEYLEIKTADAKCCVSVDYVKSIILENGQKYIFKKHKIRVKK